MEAAFADGSYGHSLWPGLEVLPQDIRVKKNRFGAFVPGSSDLHAVLQARGIDTVIITGTATNVCCEFDGARCDDDELQGDLRVRRHRHLQ